MIILLNSAISDIIVKIERSFIMTLKKWLGIFLCIIMIFSFIPVSATEVSPANTTSSTPNDELNIGAESVILMDADTKAILYEKNAYDKHYPASITKLMTALLAIENLSPDDTITFTQEAVYSIEPGSNHLWMDVGEQITVDQALHGLLLESANEVANGLGEAVSGSIDGFAKLMTDRAKELGAQNTNFVNPNGLHDPNHYTTAYDMALIASYLTTNDYFLQIMKDTSYQIPPTNKMNEIRYLAQQHPLINPVKNPSLFREDAIGGKTGYTNEARQTLVTMARRGDTTLVAVVLKAEKSNVYSDTNTLLDYGFNSYTSKTLHTSDEIIKSLPMYAVKSGQMYLAANCGLSLTKDAKILVNNQVDTNNITLSFNLPDSLTSTAQIGDRVGSVDFVLDSKTLYSADLVISKIDAEPEPNFVLLYGKVFLKSPWFIVLMIISMVLIIMLILFILKRNNNNRKRRKLKRLFK